MARDRELPPPLEMICLNALWDLGEGNVEEVRRLISQGRPLAYTTVLTLLDRLTRRGAVSRRREGRGFRYQPTAERDKLRRIALSQFLEIHFDNSVAKLRIFIEEPLEPAPPQLSGEIARTPSDSGKAPSETGKAAAAAAGAGSSSE